MPEPANPFLKRNLLLSGTRSLSSLTDFLSAVTDFLSAVTDFLSAVTDYLFAVTDFLFAVTGSPSSLTDFFCICSFPPLPCCIFPQNFLLSSIFHTRVTMFLTFDRFRVILSKKNSYQCGHDH